MKDAAHVLLTVPQRVIADVIINEQHARVFGRCATEWDRNFFRPYLLGGSLDAVGLQEILSRDMESFSVAHQAWPMKLSGWN